MCSINRAGDLRVSSDIYASLAAAIPEQVRFRPSEHQLLSGTSARSSRPTAKRRSPSENPVAFRRDPTQSGLGAPLRVLVVLDNARYVTPTGFAGPGVRRAAARAAFAGADRDSGDPRRRRRWHRFDGCSLRLDDALSRAPQVLQECLPFLDGALRRPVDEKHEQTFAGKRTVI
jgi:hypothetical protein